MKTVAIVGARPNFMKIAPIVQEIAQLPMSPSTLPRIHPYTQRSLGWEGCGENCGGDLGSGSLQYKARVGMGGKVKTPWFVNYKELTLGVLGVQGGKNEIQSNFRRE